MIHNLKYLTIVTAAGILTALSSCSITKRMPDDAYLLKRSVVKVDMQAPRKERIPAGELDRYVQQSPNRRFLGTNLYAWLHSQSDPEKDNGWNRFLRRVGDPPVVWSAEKTELTRQNFETYLSSRGFLESEAWYEVDTLRNRKIRVTYSERQGEASRIASIRYNFRDGSLRELVMRDSVRTLLRVGDIFDVNVMSAERERIASILRDRGYYDFNVGNITYEYTRGEGNLIELTMIIHRRLDGYREDGTPRYADNRVRRLESIYVYPDYDPLATGTAALERPTADTVVARGLNIVYHGKLKIRPRVLDRAIRLRAGSVYSARQVATTSSELMRMGTFRSASVLFDPIGDSLLRCDIRAVPALRQNVRFDLEGSTTSIFYGLRATLGYQNRNLFRGAELFDASLTAGFEFIKAKESERKLSYELGANISFTFPRFLFFWDIDKRNRARTPSSRLALSGGWQDRVYYTRAMFGFNWGYSWGVRRFGNFSVRPLDVNLVRKLYMNPDFERQLNNDYLVASYDDQLIAGISLSYVYNNQPRDLGAGAVVFRANAETTGNLLSGVVPLLSKPAPEGYYKFLGIQFSQYVRGDVSFSQKIVLGEKTALAYRLQAGAIYSYGNSTSPPFDKLFFAGGANSMRGWAVRTLGPGTQLYERKDYPAQMGDVKLEANLEVRFPIWNAFRGAVFFDTGNIWFMRSKPDEYPDEAVFRFGNFYRQLAFNTGAGLRVDVRFVVLRLDWGVQLHSPNRPAGERWIHDFKWRNMALNFGVGYPF